MQKIDLELCSVIAWHDAYLFTALQSLKLRLCLLEPDEFDLKQRILIANLDSEGSILRSNHISNYVQLRGTMNRDRKRMLADLDEALKNPELDNPYIGYLENL